MYYNIILLHELGGEIPIERGVGGRERQEKKGVKEEKEGGGGGTEGMQVGNRMMGKAMHGTHSSLFEKEYMCARGRENRNYTCFVTAYIPLPS